MKKLYSIGGWNNNDEFDFDTYSATEICPGGVVGYDANTETVM